MEEDIYKKIYKENPKTFNEGEPEEIVKEILKYKTSGSVFELGAGQGRNAIFLAENGFSVIAQDNSHEGINSLINEAGVRKVAVKTEVSDVRSLELHENFDVFVATYMLQHLSHEETLALIKKIKKHTNPGGLNAVTAFTKRGDLYKNDLAHKDQYLEKDELRDLYSDDEWEILEYSGAMNKVYIDKPDGSQGFNAASKILARKK